MESWWDRDTEDWLQMAGIAMASWCEGTECRLAPDGDRKQREKEEKPVGEPEGGRHAGGQGAESFWGYIARD